MNASVLLIHPFFKVQLFMETNFIITAPAWTFVLTSMHLLTFDYFIPFLHFPHTSRLAFVSLYVSMSADDMWLVWDEHFTLSPKTTVLSVQTLIAAQFSQFEGSALAHD